MFHEKLLFKLNVLYQKLEEDILPSISSPKDFELDSNIMRYKHIFHEH